MIQSIANKNYLIDLPGNRITFLDSRFYFSEGGIPVPSVTTILEAYPKGAEYYAWLKKVGEDADTIRDEAGKRGSKVHELTERFDNGIEVSLFKPLFSHEGVIDSTGSYEMSMSMREWAMFEKYVEFTRRFPNENVAIEMNVISESLGYAGTLDRIKIFEDFAPLKGKKVLIDIKTSNAVYESYWLQLAAYRRLLDAMNNPVDDVAILWLNARTRSNGKKDTCQGEGWQLCMRTQAEQMKDLRLFEHTHALWLSQNEDVQPKQTSYSITHIKQKQHDNSNRSEAAQQTA